MKLINKIILASISLCSLCAPLVYGADSSFTFSFYSTWLDSTEGTKTNLVYSPYSLRLALEIPYLGAKGKTAEQMKTILGYPLEPTKDKSFDIVNGVWLQNDFEINADYLKTIKVNLNAEVKRVDFVKQPSKALLEINRFISIQTKGHIQNLFSPDYVQKDTRLLIANIIHFIGDWQHPFDPNNSFPRPFLSRGRPTKSVTMMEQEGVFPFYKNDQFSVLEMRYKGNFSMYILLPNREDGIDTIDQFLMKNTSYGWLGELKTRRVHVQMPNMKVSHKLSSKSILQMMGLTLPFSSKADFSGISSTPNLYIADVVHEAVVAIDEKGTEASAATGASINVTSAPLPTETENFKVDHPFVFLIYNRMTKETIFIGRIIEP